MFTKSLQQDLAFDGSFRGTVFKTHPSLEMDIYSFYQKDFRLRFYMLPPDKMTVYQSYCDFLKERELPEASILYFLLRIQAIHALKLDDVFFNCKQTYHSTQFLQLAAKNDCLTGNLKYPVDIRDLIDEGVKWYERTPQIAVVHTINQFINRPYAVTVWTNAFFVLRHWYKNETMMFRIIGDDSDTGLYVNLGRLLAHVTPYSIAETPAIFKGLSYFDNGENLNSMFEPLLPEYISQSLPVNFIDKMLQGFENRLSQLSQEQKQKEIMQNIWRQEKEAREIAVMRDKIKHEMKTKQDMFSMQAESIVRLLKTTKVLNPQQQQLIIDVIKQLFRAPELTVSAHFGFSEHQNFILTRDLSLLTQVLMTLPKGYPSSWLCEGSNFDTNELRRQVCDEFVKHWDLNEQLDKIGVYYLKVFGFDRNKYPTSLATQEFIEGLRKNPYTELGLRISEKHRKQIVSMFDRFQYQQYNQR